MFKSIILAASATLVLGQADDAACMTCVDNDFLTQDMIRASFEPEEFLIKYDTPAIAGPGGTLVLRGLDSTPIIGGIRDEGVTTGILTLLPCGVITPQTHPGGAENVFGISGTIRVGFVGTGRVIDEEVNAMESFQIPQGLVHWVENESCDTAAVSMVALPAADPGIVMVAPDLFNVPDSILFATFPDLPAEAVMASKASALAAGLPSLNPECVARCAAAGSGGYGDAAE